MKKFLFVLPALAFSSLALASGTDDSRQVAYWELLVEKIFNIGLLLGVLVSIILLIFGGVFYAAQVLDKDALAKRDLKPMSILSFLGIICLASILFSPISSFIMINDITGLNPSDKASMSICVANNITISHYEWTASADQCIERMEQKIQDLANHLNEDHFEAANLPLLFKVIQAVAVFFFVVSGTVLGKHMLGYRNLKYTKGQVVMAMFACGVLFSAPMLVDYWNDISGSDNDIISDSTG
tara:strand:+ start:246199 stop:246921 length:723 start_codon:yes stop_codon:yes gene_type:complete